MVYGLPAPGEANWDTKLDASIEAVKATADAARATADSALPATEKGAASGVAPLDAGSLLPETHVPERLTEPSLTATFVAYVTGAVGDGIADDTAAVQATIDAVSAAGGGTVEGDPRKTYGVSALLTQPDGVRLRNLRFKRIANVFDVLTNSDPIGGNTRLGLENVYVDGNRAADALTQATVAHRFCGIRWINVTASTIDAEVAGTVNGELQAEGNRAAIALEDCSDVDVISRTSDNDGTGLMLFGTTHDCDIIRHRSVEDTGSGFSSEETTYDNHLGDIRSVDNGIGQAAGSYSAISINGPGYTADHLESLRANAGGINVGHQTQDADGFRATFIKSTDSGLSDLIVRGSDDIEIAVAQLSGGGGGGIGGHGNVRVYPECNRVRIGRLTGRDAVSAGVLIEGGEGHSLDWFDVSGAGGNGVQSAVPIKARGRAYNNGQAGVAGGVVLVGVADAELDIECFDDQAVKTQDYGLWLSGGGSNVALRANLHDNGTSDLYTTDGAVRPRILSGRIGAGLLHTPGSSTLAKVRRSATAQSVPNAAATAVVWDNIDWEDVDLIDVAGATPTRLTIPSGLAARRVRLEAAVIFAANATGIRRLSVVKNGATYLGDHNITAASAAETAIQVVAYDTAPVAGDYYEVIAYQTSGGALNLLANVRNWCALSLA